MYFELFDLLYHRIFKHCHAETAQLAYTFVHATSHTGCDNSRNKITLESALGLLIRDKHLQQKPSSL